MDKDKQIKLLNELVEINNDRVEGYETAAQEAKTTDLQSLFDDMKSASRQNLSELKQEVSALGGKPEEGTRNSGKLYRAWMDMKAALTGNDRSAILSSCKFGEDQALQVYDKVLKNEDSELTPSQVAMVSKQRASLTSYHDRIKSLRDAAKK